MSELQIFIAFVVVCLAIGIAMNVIAMQFEDHRP